jgi:hypothetical protein
MKNLKTKEDCAVATGRDPKIQPIVSHLLEKDAKKAIADYWLPIVIEAINKSIPPDWANDEEEKLSPWFDVIEDKSKPSGFGLSCDVCGDASTFTTVGSRLTFRTEEGLIYAVNQFPDLYEEVYL